MKLLGTVTPSSKRIKVAPQAATYKVAAMCGDEAIELNARTYVDNEGVLHVQKTGISAGDVILITAESVYTNPSGKTTKYTAEYTATVIDIQPATD